MAHSTREEWVKWLKDYGADKFYDAFMRTVEGAESTCVQCGKAIKVDISIGGGVPDWSADGDFGCNESPDTNEEGTGGHVAHGTARV